MLNHAIPEQVTYTYDDAREGLVVTATRNISVGEEVCLNYGLKTTSEIFANYGFIPRTDMEEVQSLDSVEFAL